MKTTEFIKKFVTKYQIEENRYSCLIIAISDARRLTGRNIETGKDEYDILHNKQTFLNPYSFIGIINYLLFLEMIGEVFSKKSFTTTKTNNIYAAIKQFGNTISDNDIEMLIALRNSLAHNYGLVNIPRSSKEFGTKRHKFVLDNSVGQVVLAKYPTKSWNGSFLDKAEETSTIVYTIQLVELVESIYQKLKEEIDQNAVILALAGGSDELKTRFTVRY